MKRYFVFGGPKYYAAGGMRDFLWATDDIETAESLISRDETNATSYNDWYQIVDTETGAFIRDGGGHC